VKESKSGNFSFWLGKKHIVGVSGEAARKMYLDHDDLDFVLGNVHLLGIGPDYKFPVHDIVKTGTFNNGRSYLQRRLIDLLETEQLLSHLPRITRDACSAFEIVARNSSGVVNPFPLCYPVVLAQACRIVNTDEISDSPELLKSLMGYSLVLQSANSRPSVATPWLPSYQFMRRQYGRYGINSIMTKIVNDRLKPGAPRKDDALQVLIDNGDRKDYMIEFMVSILFITIGNAGTLTGGMLYILAHHPVWQEKVYNEVKAAMNAESKNKDAALAEQLDSLSLDAWESSFPSVQLCLTEAIRMYTAFPMFRLNTASTAIPIPGSNEVIPPGSFAT
jgi:cytochrome P450